MDELARIGTMIALAGIAVWIIWKSLHNGTPDGEKRGER